MAQPTRPTKAMSSRLMNMKFMQRGTPPGTPSEPPSKRQRMSNGTAYSTPASTPRSQTEAEVDSEPSQSDLRRPEETKWYFNIEESPSVTRDSRTLRIVSAGYSTIDGPATAVDASSAEQVEDGESVTPPQIQGRRSFGKFNRKIEKQQNGGVADPESPSSSDSSKDEEDVDQDEDEDSDDATGAKAMIAQSRKEAGDRARAERKAKRKAEKAEAARLAEGRRNKQVKLNKLTSISGGGAGTPVKGSSSRDTTCYTCGEKGHMKKDCPRA